MKKILTATILASFMLTNITPVLAIEDIQKSTATPKQYKSMAKKNKKASDDYKYAYVNMEWWENFNDPQLKTYISQAVKNNYDLKMASLAVEEYYQQTRISFANELPSATVGYSPNLVKMPGMTNTAGSFVAPALVQYEVDIFLKNRDKTKSVKKLWEGSKLDERAAYISVASAVGTTYLNIVKLDKLIALQEEIVNDRKEIYDLMLLRHNEGITSTADTVRANKAYVAGTTDLIELQKQREKEQKKIEKEKRKRLEKLKKEKTENQTIEILTEEKFIGAKELPPVNKKAIEKLKKQKRKAKNKRKKEIIKQAKREEKERLKRQRPQITEKQARKIKMVKKALINVSLIILIITAITLFLLSPIFNIENISIKNNEKLSQEEIISLSQIEKGTNLFKIRNAEIKNNIKENAYVDEVKVNRILPNTIEITVTERKVAYLLEYGSSYAYIDEQGYILEISSENITDKIKIRGYKTTEDNIKPGNRLIKEDLNKLNDVAIITDTAKNSGINAQITSINIENQNEYSLYMEAEKKTVHIGSISNLDTKMLYLQVMLEKEKDNEGEIFLNIDFKTKNPYFKEKV